MTLRVIGDIPLSGRRVLTRTDINVPVEAGEVSDLTRIERAAPTIAEIRRLGGIPILLSHLGRPTTGVDPDLSLKQLVPLLATVLKCDVQFCEKTVGDCATAQVRELKPGDVILMENLRFDPGESMNDPAYVEKLAQLGDVYCNDAFSVSHRRHASICGIAKRVPSFAGCSLVNELKILASVLGDAKRPLAAVVGGSKISTKLSLLGNLVMKVDYLLVGGAMANTFLLAKCCEVGKSLVEPNLVRSAVEILQLADQQGCKILLPVDLVVSKKLAPNAPIRVVHADGCPEDSMILDAGPRTIQQFGAVLERCRTAIWNGPLGAFETFPFDSATNELARKVASLTEAGTLNSVAGGGDTLAALNRSDTTASFRYVSTAGGAFLEWMEGKTLPGIAVLEA